ncbi:stage III sporulation protein AF [Clostridium saccharobutylicum]|uniref:Stage III sporulation protein AF n=1 Tax=Clostridium saccharobutylicum DSM 13864 TaxID=1345695 RepID=U5MS80_CLOSA|nr:stage III sporulation protein AF [Clostridium saccharobutylicum]AGX43664.1 stage III sporulation protein AF [Clostridium saccharobutylicum DSM 13864]AQR90962.1 stage III sporulation protein SpoIIIAF [Clostridium saccharobutylicum]AQS00866.1 stage III sporulation protein SpoIIIAF [Clostridium saccharobutylicum]AQS14849.1 stage III sporulation protein SpoIIIAF [Clostridium saccharobutylicum]MBA2907108.1 stage III sporulation protein AF [Clostridium saccharobutylicum]
MFIETLKGIVTTLVTILIFISAVELISPNNKMKKYIKFVLGLILISAILNPILQFISKGQKNISQGIEKYETVFSEKQNKINSDNSNSIDSKEDKNDARKKAFIKNFDENCDNLLKNKYKDMNFKSDVDCDIDFTNINFNIKKLRIGVENNKISKIKKVEINGKGQESTEDDNKEYEDIINFVSDELSVSKDKIEVYKMKE